MVQEKGRLFETYNVGGHNEKQNIEIVKTILEVLREELDDSDPRKQNVSENRESASPGTGKGRSCSSSS